ncbi:anti-sigma factor family protein [Protofrankia symbiont of Coriaria ruscifolia]|uniref:anti-sigma factor family protein n=1 Tax=Protofrankia symbiont of Coriaria ruscifolia TaxID=1306542 RepID=UPI0010416F10|nr:zf-HC2 domain-containing protein [Protofrankia symbiont of Coriaria ruscifolia]
MSGPHLGEQIAPLVDGQLDHDDRDRALAHLACCPSCQWEVAELRRLKARLAALGGPVLPGCVADRLLRMAAVAIPARFAADTRFAPDNGRAHPVGPMVPVGPVVPAGYSIVQLPADSPGTFRSDHSHCRGGARTPGSTRSTLQVRVSTGRVMFTVGLVGPVATSKSSKLSRILKKDGRKTVRRSIRPRVALRVTMPAAGGRRPPSGPADPRARGARRPSRTRRTLVGSAAVLFFAVAGAAFGETRAPSGLPGPSTHPVVAPVVRPSLVSEVRVSRLLPVMAVVSVPTGVRR